MNNPWNIFADSFLTTWYWFSCKNIFVAISLYSIIFFTRHWYAGLDEGGTAAISMGSCSESIHILHPGEGGHFLIWSFRLCAIRPSMLSSSSIVQIIGKFRSYSNTIVFLPCFNQYFAYGLSLPWNEWNVLTTKTIQPRRQVFSVKGSIIWQFCCTLSTIDIIFQISQNSSKFGRQ